VSEESYSFKIGGFNCLAVSDGTLTYAPPTFPTPATLLFANAPKALLEQVLSEHGLQLKQWVEWVSPYICVVIDTGEHKVLVDTGAGNLGPDTGHLLMNLQAEGITPTDIDTVILTHGHPDHIGGNVDSDGNLAFPNALYLMWKSEWDFWNSELKRDEPVNEVLRKVARRNLPPISDQIRLVERETEIVPGIFAVAAPGHTPGHMALSVSSDGECLLCIADAVLHPIHIEQPSWHAVVDVFPKQVEKTRRKLFNRAMREKALVLAFHFLFPGLGHLIQKKEQYRWQPL
jgi:glyoxylase-like metal-dependent hydrolase (beta-lactamase superfamily II)